MLSTPKGHILVIFYLKVPIPTSALWGAAPILSCLSRSSSWLIPAVLFLWPLSCPSVSISQGCTLDSSLGTLHSCPTESREVGAPSGMAGGAACPEGPLCSWRLWHGGHCPAEGSCCAQLSAARFVLCQLSTAGSATPCSKPARLILQISDWEIPTAARECKMYSTWRSL